MALKFGDVVKIHFLSPWIMEKAPNRRSELALHNACIEARAQAIAHFEYRNGVRLQLSDQGNFDGELLNGRARCLVITTNRQEMFDGGAKS